MVQEFISVSKACKLQNLSVKKVLDFMSSQALIPKPSQRKNRTFKTSNGLVDVISNGNSLKVNLSQFNDFIADKDLSILSYTDENKEILDLVENPEIRFKRISEIADTKLLFVDAELKNGNYHEIAYELVESGVVIDSGYFVELRHFKKIVRRHGSYNRVNRLKQHGRRFEILARKHINRRLKKLCSDANYIIAHNAYGERNLLIKNGIRYEKTKFICTSKMAEGFIFSRPPSLKELNDYYHLSYDSHFTHYAFEDTAMARKLFFKMISDAGEKFGIGV